jgi:glyoxalase family protein
VQPDHDKAMKLEGIHHITAITGDAPRNVDFYARVLGLRLVKKTVNQDDPSVYHLFYGDDEGNPGMDLTFFEFPGVAPGRAGPGMVHRIVWRVGSSQAIDFWHKRLSEEAVSVEHKDGRLRFQDFEGLSHELFVDSSTDPPLTADHPQVPAEYALQGFAGVRAYTDRPHTSRRLLEAGLGFQPAEDGWQVRGEKRGSFYVYDPPDGQAPIQGAGTVHHVAWAAPLDEHSAWRERVIAGGGRPTPVIDRFYFRSIYFREPSGVLFEIASIGPGFAVDEDPDHLGEGLALPPAFEHLREQVENSLTPLPESHALR